MPRTTAILGIYKTKRRKHLSDEERQKGAIERNSGENELRPSSEE
jgi:hypothetical protein